VKRRPDGPSAAEMKLRSEVDRLRRDLSKEKKKQPEPGTPASVPESPPASEVEALRRQVAELTSAKQRLGQLYFRQPADGSRRAA